MSQTTEQIKETLSGARFTPHRWGAIRTGTRSEQLKCADAMGVSKVAPVKRPRKEVIDTNHHTWKALTAALSKAGCWWETVTFPYVGEGQRLFQRARKKAIWGQVEEHNQTIVGKAKALDDVREELLSEARETLGEAFHLS